VVRRTDLRRLQEARDWLLEGDFIQYSVEGSSSGLSYAQLGQLAAQITLAIKCNDPLPWSPSTTQAGLAPRN